MQANTSATRISAWRVCVVGFVLIGLLSSQAIAATLITGVNVVNKPDRVLISVSGTTPLKMMPFSSTIGRYLGFQFSGLLTPKGRLVKIYSGRIYNVRYSNFSVNPRIARIVVNTSSHLDYSTEWSEDKKQVEISVWKFDAKPEAKATAEVESAVVMDDTPKPALCTTGVERAISRIPQGSDPGNTVEPALKLTDKPVQVALLAPSIAQTPAPEVAEAEKTEKKVSLNFLGADINDVLKALSVQSGENIVASKDVKGEVTVSLSDVSLEQALNYVAKLSGYNYVKENGTYLVGSNLPTSSNSDLEFVWLQYANAEDVISLLKVRFPQLQVNLFGQTNQANNTKSESDKKDSLFSEYTWMREVPPSGSTIVLSGDPGDINDAKQLIAQVDDTIHKQKEAARKWINDKKREYYTAKYANPAQLAQTLTALLPNVSIGFAPANGWGLVGFKSAKTDEDGIPKVERDIRDPTAKASGKDESGGDTKSGDSKSSSQLTGATSRTLIIIGKEDAVERALTLAAELDIKAPQIKIEAKITSINKTGEEELGLDWSWDKISFTESPRNTWTRNATNFTATLDALVKNNNANILASPNLLCIEGEPGVFFVGDEVTYVSSVSASSSGEKTYQTDTAKAGVNLTVVSNVSKDGYITLYIHAEVSSLSLATQESVTLPTISRRYTDQVVRVKDGATIAIGGLIRQDEIENMSKIPLLGDLPFFGQLFRHKDKSSEKNEVVMFITASSTKD